MTVYPVFRASAIPVITLSDQPELCAASGGQWVNAGAPAQDLGDGAGHQERTQVIA